MKRDRTEEAAYVRTLTDAKLSKRLDVVRGQIPRAYDYGFKYSDLLPLENLQMMDEVIAAERMRRLVKKDS